MPTLARIVVGLLVAALTVVLGPVSAAHAAMTAGCITANSSNFGSSNFELPKNRVKRVCNSASSDAKLKVWDTDEHGILEPVMILRPGKCFTRDYNYWPKITVGRGYAAEIRFNPPGPRKHAGRYVENFNGVRALRYELPWGGDFKVQLIKG